jgi:glycosyltransferase involved in cell wall biosynthesis
MNQLDSHGEVGIGQLAQAGCQAGSVSVVPAAGSRVDARAPARGATICHVMHDLIVGGAQVLAAELARQLRDSYRFLFICLDDLGTLGRELREEGFPVEVLGRRPGQDWRCARRLAAIVRREQVDLLHAHQYTPFFYSTVSRLLGSRPPIFFTEHGRHHPDYPRWKRILANRVLLRGHDRVVAVGEAVRQALIHNEGIPPGRVEVIYNGISLERFETRLTETERAAVRAAIGLDPDDLVLIQVARLDRLKDHATAIRTIERVAGRCPRARLVLVGDGPERGTIEELVGHRSLRDNVRLLGERDDVPRLLAASDIALLTSISEGIPLALIEAMAARRAVVSTQVGGVAEVVADGQTGLLAPAGDDTALAEHILLLADDSLRRDQMGRMGRQRAQELFSVRRMHDSYRLIYAEMVLRKR